jgi:hypothetical protein
MIGLATRSLRSNLSIFKLTLRESRAFLLYYKSTDKTCIRGYVPSYNKRNLFYGTLIFKKDTLETKLLNTSTHRIFSTKE